MTARLRCWWFASLAGSVALALPGCRDTEPTPSHFRDLGGGGPDDRILLLTGSPWYEYELTEEIRTGSDTAQRADWVPFREPDFEGVAEAAEERSGPEGGPADTNAIEATIRELIEQYNEIAAEGDVEELLEYHVEAQQDTIRAMFEAATTAMERLEAVRTAFKEKLPDQAERVDAAVDLLMKGAPTTGLTVDSLAIESDTEITGSPPAGSGRPMCRFRLIDDEWYIELQDLPDFSQLKAQIDVLLAGFDEWVQGLRSGRLPAAALLEQIEVQAKVIAASRSSGAQPVGDQEPEAEEDDAGDDGG